MNTRYSIFATSFFAIVIYSSPIQADFITIAQPSQDYLAATTLLPITAPDFTIATSLTDLFQMASFSNLEAFSVPTTWTTWSSTPYSETSTPRVLWTGFGIVYTEISLAIPTNIFGVELQPNNQDAIATVFADFYEGGTSGILVGSISQSVNGNAGARLFAASSTTNSFDTIALSIDFHQDDSFGIAQVRYGSISSVPEPNCLNLLGCACLFSTALAGWHRRRTHSTGFLALRQRLLKVAKDCALWEHHWGIRVNPVFGFRGPDPFVLTQTGD